MFKGCDALERINLNRFSTANVSTMQAMFYGCKSLTNIDLGSFDTRKTGSMAMMFGECSKLTTIYVGKNWKYANKKAEMTAGCPKIKWVQRK
jgi:surface protein